MQITLRFLPNAATEIVQARPPAPIGEDRERHPRALPLSIPEEQPPGREQGAVPDRSHRLTILPGDPPRPLLASWAVPGTSGAIEQPVDGRSFIRELLSSAAFLAQHLGSVPPYRNEPVLRTAAEGAYRTASALSTEIVGASEPLDIRI